MKNNHLDEIDLIRIVNKKIDEAGSMTAFAKHCGISKQHLGKMLSGDYKRGFSPEVLSQLGIRRVVRVHYEYESDGI